MTEKEIIKIDIYERSRDYITANKLIEIFVQIKIKIFITLLRHLTGHVLFKVTFSENHVIVVRPITTFHGLFDLNKLF